MLHRPTRLTRGGQHGGPGASRTRWLSLWRRSRSHDLGPIWGDRGELNPQIARSQRAALPVEPRPQGARSAAPRLDAGAATRNRTSPVALTRGNDAPALAATLVPRTGIEPVFPLYQSESLPLTYRGRIWCRSRELNPSGRRYEGHLSPARAAKHGARDGSRTHGLRRDKPAGTATPLRMRGSG